MRIKRRTIWIFLSLLLAAGCESLEDTYSDYAGDGTVRYLGSCSDLNVTPGWKRFAVTWSNSVDPVIDKVQVTWTGNGIKRDTLLAPGVDSVSLPAAQDGSYEISLCNIGKDGSSSMVKTAYSRPLTFAHEQVISFSRLISEQYFIGNRLALIFSEWQDNILSAELKYYTPDGELHSFPVTAEVVNAKCLLLEDEIDPEKPVTLERKGRPVGCPDIIEFEPLEISRNKLFSIEFKRWIQEKYGQDEFTEEFVSNLKELEIDYSIRSLTDILNLPNLEKLSLGKNRYLYEGPGYLQKFWASSQLTDTVSSLFALKIANELLGLQVDRYNQHYFSDFEKPAFVNSLSNPKAPALQFLDADTWTKTCSVTLEYADLKDLFDGNATTEWQPETATTGRTFEIVVDMLSPRNIAGVRVIQKTYPYWSANTYGGLLPPSIKIQVSQNNVSWEDATCVVENTLGKTPREITDIHFPVVREIRYLKFIVYDHPFQAGYAVAMSDIGIFGPQE